MILLTDGMFPSKYAKWRIEEIKAFIEEKNADIIVNKVASYAGIDYKVDYDEMKEYFNLDKFNILIFDPKYNYLNKYNSRVDGTKFNGKSKYSYLFTTKTSFDIKEYDSIYHIFLSSYQKFNVEFKVAPEKQYIHLYPGGGYSASSFLQALPRTVNIISTQPFCTQHLKNHGFKSYIEAFGSTLLPKDHVVVPKQKNNGTLKVCFASMGHGAHKGSDCFIRAVEVYKKFYPNDNVKFILIGSTTGLAPLSDSLMKHISFLSPMPQKDLDKFYREEADVLVNCETGAALNGWPLGAEAALNGVVLITTDVNGVNKQFKYTDDMLKIIAANNVTQIVSAIKPLHDDRNKLHSMSQNIQSHSLNVFSYNNQQQKIFDFIDNRHMYDGLSQYRVVCPHYEHEDSIYTIKSGFVNADCLQKQFVNIVENNVYDFMFNNLKENKPFTMARYNDGEWIASLKIKDNRLYEVHFPKWNASGQQFVDEKLTPIIKRGMNYHVGVSSEVMKKTYMMKYIQPHLKDTKLFDGGLFARMSINGSLLKLFELLEKKDVIVIGPKYLKELDRWFSFKLIETNPHDVWDDYATIYDQAHTLIKQNPNATIIYACSFVAKVLIDEFYEMYSSTITQLDIGAALDVFCGVDSRPWHNHIKEKVGTMKYAIIGAGGFGREVYHHMKQDFPKSVIEMFVDDQYCTEGVKPLSSLNIKDYRVVVAIGDPKKRADVIARLPANTKYFTFIHSSVINLDPKNEIGEGSIICAGAILTTNIRLGKHTHLNLGTTIGHDCEIGDYFTTAPKVAISGNCKIGDGVYFGTNACVREKIEICDNVTIGLNSGVVKDILQPGTYIGTPCRLL